VFLEQVQRTMQQLQCMQQSMQGCWLQMQQTMLDVHGRHQHRHQHQHQHQVAHTSKNSWCICGGGGGGSGGGLCGSDDGSAGGCGGGAGGANLSHARSGKYIGNNEAEMLSHQRQQQQLFILISPTNGSNSSTSGHGNGKSTSSSDSTDCGSFFLQHDRLDLCPLALSRRTPSPAPLL
jgi:hypothetical protein